MRARHVENTGFADCQQDENLILFKVLIHPVPYVCERSARMKEKFSFDRLQSRFLLHKKVNGLGESTLATYRKVFMNFQTQLGYPMDYDNIYEQTGSFFFEINWYSNSTFNNQRACLNCYFEWLVEKEEIDYNPIKELGIKRRKDTNNPRPTSREDLAKLLSVIPKYGYAGIRDYTIIILIADTGIRPAEVLRIKKSNVDLRKRIIRLTPDITKTKTERIAPFSKDVKNNLSKLMQIVDSIWLDKEFIFLKENGDEMRTHVLRESMKRYSEKAGVKITPYQLRHFYGTEYLREGGNLLYLQKVMGHSNLETTRKYIEIDEEDLIRSHEMTSPLRSIIKSSRIAPRDVRDIDFE